MSLEQEIEAIVKANLGFIQEHPVFTTQLGMFIKKHVPTIKVTNFHGTASGVRLVMTFATDQHHEYEVLINPLYKEKTPCPTTPK